VGGFLGNIWGDVTSGLVGSGVFVEQTVKAAVNDAAAAVVGAARGPSLGAPKTMGGSGLGPSITQKAAGLKVGSLEKLGTSMAKQYTRQYGRLIHDPGGALYDDAFLFALDALSVASLGAGTAARVGEAGRALRTGEGAAAAARALTAKPPIALRYAKIPVEGKEVQMLLGAYSRDPAAKLAQVHLDKLRHKYPNTPFLSRSLNNKVNFQLQQMMRIENSLAEGPVNAYRGAISRWARTAAKQRALRVVAEGVPLKQRIKIHKADLAKATNKETRKRLNAEIGLLEKAGKYIDDSGHKPVLTDPNLQKVYDIGGDLNREELLANLDVLDPARAEARVQAPGRVFFGAEHVPSTPARRGVPSKALVASRARVDRLQAAFDKAITAGVSRPLAQGRLAQAQRQFAVLRERVPTEEFGARVRAGQLRASERDLKLAEQAVKEALPELSPRAQRLGGALSIAKEELSRQESMARGRIRRTGLVGEEEFRGGEQFFTYGQRTPRTFIGLGPRKVLREPRPPTMHEFTGEAIREGRIPRGEALVKAEMMLEALRLTAIVRNRELLRPLGKLTPETDNDVALVVGNLNRLPDEVRAVLGQLHEGEYLPEDVHLGIGPAATALARQIIPGKLKDLRHDPRFADVYDKPILDPVTGEPQILWFNPKHIGNLGTPSPLVGLAQHPVGRKFLGVFDAINNAERLAILYLLPLKYVGQNLIGQAALNLLQQGFASVYQLRQNVMLWHQLSESDRATIMSGMQEGMVAAVRGKQGSGDLFRLGELNTWFAGKYGKVIDKPFRASAFLYEARRSGHTSAEAIHDLLHNPDKRDLRNATFLEANGEIIDYARLSPVERDIIRRVIFFYPWVKGATVYTGRMIQQHPVKTGLISHAGQVGTDIQRETLGEDLPSYAAALAPWGESGGYPTTLNLMSLNPFTTPYQTAEAALSFRPEALSEMLSPAAGAAIVAYTGRDPRGFPAHQLPGFGGPLTRPGIGLRQLGEGLPEYNYLDRLIGGAPSRASYPTTQLEALFALLFGPGVTPRRTNVAQLAEQARRGR
jgi:hypothetical protein